jgi:hypothetical protein
MTDPMPQCCKAIAWRLAAAEAEVRRIAAQLARNDTPQGREQLTTARAVLADNRRWATEHHANHAGEPE